MKKIEDYSFAVDAIRNELSNYIQKYGLKSLVLGVSGGIDSALVAALAKPVCDELGVPLIGMSITIETNKPVEIARAEAVGKSFCTYFKEIDLTEEYLYIKSKLLDDDSDIYIGDESEMSKKIRLGNTKARLRMARLYDLAHKNKGLVLSTDNYTEYLLGFWTLHGDVGDYGMIQNLWKSEVYDMSRYIVEEELVDPKDKKALMDCVNALPTDGLGITNSDLDQIGAKSYDEVDLMLIEYLETGEIKNPKVIDRHLKSMFKRNNPTNLPRDIYFDKHGSVEKFTDFKKK